MPRTDREQPMATTGEKRLLDLEEIAQMLKKSERGIRHLVSTGQIPFHRVGRELRFDADEVLDATRGTPARPA
jgi:excisionase family DNA binding protein